MWEPERRQAGGEEPSQESWKHSRKYLCAVRGRAEALGLPPTLPLLGLSASSPALPPKLLEGGAQTHAQHTPHSQDHCPFLPVSLSWYLPEEMLSSAAPILIPEDRAGPRVSNSV